MSRTSAASPMLFVIGKDIRCCHRRSIFGNDRLCDQLLVKDYAIKCPRCKQTHSVIDMVASIPNGIESQHAHLMQAVQIRFWEAKAIADMSEYHHDQACRIESWPEWMRRQIGLIESKRFSAVWLWNTWVLIERQPWTVHDLLMGTENRMATEEQLPQMFERFAHFTGLRKSGLMLPDDLGMLRDVQQARTFLAQRNVWVNGTSWADTDSYWTSCGWRQITNLVTGSRKATVDDQAKYQFIVHNG
ncbi:MAG: hypothetical protein AAB619_02205 [Patescibacteria group bacterium]